jgi:peroxiredoxin
MKKRNVSVLNVILVIIILVLLTVIGFQFVENKYLRANSFSLYPGESLPQLDLITLENEPLDKSIFSDGVVLFMCFEVPCAKCNKNLTSWMNLTQYFGDKIKVVGIIPDGDPKAFQLIEERQVTFPLYLPGDQKTLRQQMRLRGKRAQTIVVYKNKVKAVKIGILSRDDVNYLRETIQELL